MQDYHTQHWARGYMLSYRLGFVWPVYAHFLRREGAQFVFDVAGQEWRSGVERKLLSWAPYFNKGGLYRVHLDRSAPTAQITHMEPPTMPVFNGNDACVAYDSDGWAIPCDPGCEREYYRPFDVYWLKPGAKRED